MEKYGQNIDFEIERLLENSSVSPLLKAIVKAALSSMPYSSKLSIVKSLQKEQRKLLLLKKREEKIIEKYRLMMEKLSKESHVSAHEEKRFPPSATADRSRE